RGLAELLALEVLVDRADELDARHAAIGELLDHQLGGRARRDHRLGRARRAIDGSIDTHHCLQKCSDLAWVRSSRRLTSSSNSAVTSVCRLATTSKNSAVDALWHTIIPSPAPPCERSSSPPASPRARPSTTWRRSSRPNGSLICSASREPSVAIRSDGRS